MTQCIIIRNRWLFKAFIAVMATPGSTVTCTIGSTTYTGTANSTTGLVTIPVKKRGTYSVTSSAAGTQTKSVDVNAANTTFSVNIVSKFTLTITTNHASLSVKRTSSPFGGASTNVALSSGAEVYWGDVITKTGGAANTGFQSYSVTPSGLTYASGQAASGPWTVTGTCSLTASATVISYTLSINAGSNSTITINRSSSPNGGGNTGNILSKTGATGSVTVYYGDVVSWSFSVGSYYSIGTHTVGGTARNSGFSWTVTGAISCVTTANRRTVTISFTRVTGSGTGTQRFVGSIPIYMGDSLTQSVGRSASGSFQANASTTHNGTYKISQATAGSTTFKIYFLNNAGNYSATRKFSSSSIGNNSTAITSNKSFS